jgi:hypothetical protein
MDTPSAVGQIMAEHRLHVFFIMSRDIPKVEPMAVELTEAATSNLEAWTKYT